MINEQIRDREVRLIGENGEQLGIMSARDAFMLSGSRTSDRSRQDDRGSGRSRTDHI